MKYSELTPNQKSCYDDVAEGNPQDPYDFVYAEFVGCVVQFESPVTGTWRDKPKGIWSFLVNNYRLKPLDKEPREWMIGISKVNKNVVGIAEVKDNNWSMLFGSSTGEPVETIRVIEKL